jgi:hypothetical protein
MPPYVARRIAIVIAMVPLVSACTETAWVSELSPEACRSAEIEAIGPDLQPSACSCPTNTTSETWTISDNGSTCSLSAPSNPQCSATAISGGWRLTCAYPYGAPACAALRFTRPSGHNDLVGLVVSDPVCSSSPASPSTGSTITTKIQIPNYDQPDLRVDWEAWDTSMQTDTCGIQILTSENDPTMLGAFTGTENLAAP